MGNQRFQIEFDFNANMGPVKSSIEGLKKSLSEISLPTNMASNFEKIFSKLETEMTEFQALTKNGFANMVDVNKAQASFSKISKLMNQLGLEANRVKGVDPNKFLPKDVQSKVQGLLQKLEVLQQQQNKKDSYAEKIQKQTKLIKEQEKELNNLEIKRKALQEDAKSLGGKKGAETKRRDSAKEVVDTKTKERDAMIAQGAKNSSPALQAVKKDIEDYTRAVRDAQAQIDALNKKLDTNATAMRNNKASTEIAENELASLKSELAEMQSIQVDPKGLLELRQELAKLTGINLNEIPKDLEEIQQAINNLNAKETSQIANQIKKIDIALDQVGDEANNARIGMQNFVDGARGVAAAAQEVENLKNQVYQFFSLTNSVQLFKRAVLSAIETVKELDATMTEAAVVTDFSVGDMWDKLPKYSKNAQQLGVSINGLYQATTLYYQQGLATNEAMALGIETMKMAKIAGMESTEATEAMTAALRGFNMELNETSAVKVNDVYSQLAAVTAADTEQIATAMSKTASIAASANMEFETTAALLAQIIETTQEAPETAGTAMKTIIARFAEVKKLRSQGKSSGTDDEGEGIDVNKIQTALSTVGISMEGFFNGTEGLDSILLKLSEKWGTLDFETQRYIATMAAGSRQQSRFIAMMSDYGRTTELVGQAQNSAGASQKQFEKTQESLEVKLQKLKNAWDQFLMGLSNNEIIKGAVDVLTFIVDGLNKVINAISGGNGLVKSITSLIAVLGALKLARQALGGVAGKGVGAIGQKIGMGGATKETITTTDTNGGTTVQTIVREPYKEGEQSGQKAGQGFVAGFKNAINAQKAGGSVLEGFFTTGPAAEVNGKNIKPTKGIGGKFAKARDEKIQKKYEDKYKDESKNRILKQDASDATKRKNFLGEISDKNKDMSSDNFKEITQVYDDVYKETQNVGQAMDAANAKTRELNGTLLDSEQTIEMTAEQSSGLSLNMGALGGAATGVGGALGLFASLLEKLGMEEEAKAVGVLAAVFMGLGTVMSLLSSIAPILGMSFTTAGVQITTAGVTSQLAWWWVFVIIAAVALLVVGVLALAKAAKKNSLAGRMEAAAKATEAAKEAADSAKEAYDDLLSEKDKYQELQDGLKGLVEGTNEWKQALLEANSQVLELLATYPELAQYISRGEFGQLTISDEGWDMVIDDQYRGLQNAQRNVLVSQMAETKLKNEKAESDLSDEAYKKGIQTYDPNTDTMKVDTADLEAIQQEFAKNPDLWVKDSSGNYSQELEDFAASIGQTADEIYNMKDAIIDYNGTVLANNAQLKAQAEAALTASASEETLEYEYGDQVISGFANNMVSDAYDQRQKEIEDSLYSKDGSAESKNNEEFKKLAEEYGVTNEMVGKDLEDLKTLYAAMAGIAKEDIPDGIAKDKKKLAAEIAKMQAASEYTDMMEDFRENMQKLDQSKQKQVAALMSGDASNLSVNELATVKGKSLADYATGMGYANATEMGEAMGYQVQTLSALSQEDQEAYLKKQIADGAVSAETYTKEDGTLDVAKYVQENGTTQISIEAQLEIDSKQAQEKMQKVWDDSTKKLSGKTGLSNEEITNMFGESSIGVVQGLSKQVAGMSEEGAKAYIKTWEDTMKKSDLGGSQQKALENYLANVDWSSMSQAVEAMDYMQSIGLDSSQIEAFWDAATDGAATYVKTVTEALGLTERMQGKVAGVDETIDRVTSGKGTKEDVDNLIAAGVDVNKFQLTPEGWKLSKEDSVEAASKLRTHNADQAKATEEQHREGLVQAKSDASDMGIYQNSDGTWSISADNTGSMFGSNNNSYDYKQNAIRGITSISENGKLVAGTVDDSNYEYIAEYFGMEQGEDQTTEQFIAAVQERYGGYISALNNGEDIDILNQKTTAMAEAAQYTTAEAVAQGHSDESVRYSMMNEASAYGLDPAEVVAFSDSLKEAGITSQAVRDQIALDQAIMSQGAQEVNDNWEEWQKHLSDKTTIGYTKALGELNQSTKKLLGVTEDLSEEFLTNKKNQELIRKAAAGNKEALAELRKEATKDIFKSMGKEGEEVFNSIQKDIDDITSADIEVGMTVTSADDDPNNAIADKITNMYNEAVDAALRGGADLATAQQKANETVNAAGYEVPEMVEEETTVTTQAPPGLEVEAGNYIVAGDGESLRGYRWKVTEGETTTYTQTRFVPKDGTGYTKRSNSVGSSPKSSGGGSSSKWENPYEKLHNALEEINDLLRERERLERRYQRLIDQGGATYKSLQENQKETIKNYQQEKQKQEFLEKQRNKELDDLIADNPTMKKYITFETDENGDRTIRIDWEAINAVTDEEEGEKIEAFYDDSKGLLEGIYEAQTAQEEALDAIYETLQKGKDQYLTLEEQTKQALINKYQEQIDELSSVNEAITDTNSNIIDAMQQAISDARQERDNQKTEQDISDKQTKLAYLQQDTSGANQMEILKLQKEINEAQEDYTDTLIDQKISELQKQNDEAAEQRQRQIDIAQEQLDQWSESGAIWEQVEDLISGALNADGTVKPDSELMNLLKQDAGFESMSKIGQMDWMKETNNMISEGLLWLTGQGAMTSYYNGKEIEFTTADGKTVKGTVQADGTVKTSDGVIYKNVKRGMDGSFSTSENFQATEPSQPSQTETKTGSGNLASLPASSNLSKDQVKSLQKGINELIDHDKISGEKLKVDGIYGKLTKAAVKKLQTAIGESPVDGVWGSSTQKTFKNSSLKEYKTGGLADFTGPAWLDGTKSKPEYILSADQTKAFFTLVDILSSITSGGTKTTEKSGDNTYDIDINIESIGSDYDVEQMAEKIKSLINEDARYRNNNIAGYAR